MTTQIAPFAPGDTVTRLKQTYKVKSVEFGEKFGSEKGEWLVIAWRWIKKTQKYSGNAYVYRATDFSPKS
jgi:hypothetical protein